ncbi:hypothetical protein O1L55_31630 [Streptomyces albulus]|nr:hypothetical protein [Streptomyces noursei]
MTGAAGTEVALPAVVARGQPLPIAAAAAAAARRRPARRVGAVRAPPAAAGVGPARGAALAGGLVEQTLGHRTGVVLADGAAGQAHFAGVEAEQVGDDFVAADGHREGGQSPRAAGLGLVEEPLRPADLVIADAERLRKYRVALPQLPRFHDSDNGFWPVLVRLSMRDHCKR